MSSENVTLRLIGRTSGLFDCDISRLSSELTAIVEGGTFLVIGGAGSIGQAATKELFKRNPKVLHVVDISLQLSFQIFDHHLMGKQEVN